MGGGVPEMESRGSSWPGGDVMKMIWSACGWLGLATVVLFCQTLRAVSLAWDSPSTNVDGSPLTDLAGYRIYYGSASKAYQSTVDVGTATSATVHGLEPGQNLYFAVTAYNSESNESPFSPEVVWNSDVNSDGIPDSWELANFGSLNAPNSGPDDDFDGDGFSNLEEFYAGTCPTNSADYPGVSAASSNGQATVSFQALAAAGAAYDGYQRYYVLERADDLMKASWTAVSGFDNIQATNQILTVSVQGTSFYRTRLWLQ